MTEDYTLDELAETPLEDFAELLQKIEHGRFKNPEKLAKVIKKAINGSYRLNQVHQESVDIVLSLLAREIRSLDKMIKDIDRAIEEMGKLFLNINA